MQTHALTLTLDQCAAGFSEESWNKYTNNLKHRGKKIQLSLKIRGNFRPVLAKLEQSTYKYGQVKSVLFSYNASCLVNGHDQDVPFCPDPARKLSANLYDIYHCCVYSEKKNPDDGQRNCPKHVEFYSKNKFEKLVHLAGFIIRIYHDARSPERRN